MIRIAASAISGFYLADINLQVITIEVYRLAEMPVLSAIPLFTFAGYLLGEGKASQRLVRLSNSIIGCAKIKTATAIGMATTHIPRIVCRQSVLNCDLEEECNRDMTGKIAVV